jgi:hypothetical protein
MNTAASTYIAVVDAHERACRSFARVLRGAGTQPIAYGSAGAFLEDSKAAAVRLHGIRRRARRYVRHRARRRNLGVGSSAGTDHLHRTHDNPETRAIAAATGSAAYFRKSGSSADVVETILRLVA